jgi:hypothetical protein
MRCVLRDRLRKNSPCKTEKGGTGEPGPPFRSEERWVLFESQGL